MNVAAPINPAPTATKVRTPYLNGTVYLIACRWHFGKINARNNQRVNLFQIPYSIRVNYAPLKGEEAVDKLAS